MEDIPNNPTFSSPTATFNFGFFQYWHNIIENDDYGTTTNPIESINANLKNACSGGHLPFDRALQIIKEFKTDYITKHEHHVMNNNLNRRKSKTHERPTNLALLTKSVIFDYCLIQLMNLLKINKFTNNTSVSLKKM